MSYSRRHFLKRGSTSIAGAAFASTLLSSRELRANTFHGCEPTALPLDPSDDPRWMELVLRAVDTARSAGAQYADARMTFTRIREVKLQTPPVVSDSEAIHVGVRALAGGYWGFASGPVWNDEEIVRLAREAVAQAKHNVIGKPRVSELIPAPVIDGGRWATPVRIDPFDLHPMEILDFFGGVGIRSNRKHYGFVCGNASANMTRQDKVFASTDGSRYSQRVYQTRGNYNVRKGGRWARTIDSLSVAGVGWELFDQEKLYAAIDQAVEDIKIDAELPFIPVDIGRYPVVLHPRVVKDVLSGTIGKASELDRALGFEANAGGTSYLAFPEEMLGTLKIGSPVVSISANRSEAGGAATVQWDDEGVVPRDFSIVTDGVLTNYHTAREGAAWLANAGKATAAPASYGCSYAPTANDGPLVHTANLVLHAGKDPNSIQTFAEQHPKVLYFDDGAVGLDFQQLNGLVVGTRVYEMRKGKKTALVGNSGILFRAPELWKSIKAVGDSSTALRYSAETNKGEPAQKSFHSVTAVPVAADALPIIDVRRKA